MGKVVIVLCVAVAGTVLAARLAFEAGSARAEGPARAPWVQDRMEFVAWNGERWTAWIRGDAFELVPENTRDWSRHTNGSIAFIDWAGEPWQAKIDGEAFVLARRGDWREPTERAIAVRYRDWQGDNRLRTVEQLAR